MDPRLLLRLVRRRRWLLGLVLATTGFGCMATAIGSGSLTAVEPIMAGNVLVALLVSARLVGGRLRRTEWIGVAATITGVGGFLVLASPSEGDDLSSSVPWAVPLLVLLVLVVTGRVLASRLGPAQRALLLGALAGLSFGSADALLKVFTDVGDVDGFSGVLSHWSLYTWIVVGSTAFLLQQSSFHAGHIGAAMPAASSLAPTTATLLGVAMLGEDVRGGWAIPGELFFAGVLVAGIIILARSPLNDPDAVAELVADPAVVPSG
jgi:drug/metabolite transporter (DMT)-like permease